jgi:G3E family GTPase
MCGLCGMFESGRRWLDAAATLDSAQVRQERRRRLSLVRRVLKPARIGVDDWEGASFVLRGPTGKTEIVDNLFDLWRKAEALGHRASDSLAQLEVPASRQANEVSSLPREREPCVLASSRSAPRFRQDERAQRQGAQADEAQSSNHAGPGAREAAAGRIPVHVLTGFLGSGKTTLLNRILRDPALAETAVLINEIGAIAIDHHVVQNVDASEALAVVVVKGGCACCVVRGDLAAALRELYARRADGSLPPFRRVVLETTGLADPAPILFTLAADPALRHKFEAGSVITTVDVVHGAAQTTRHAENRKQIAVADWLILTKTDLAGSLSPALAAILQRLNPAAEIVQGDQSLDLGRLLESRRPIRHPSSSAPIVQTLSKAMHGHAGAFVAEHTPDIDSVSMRLDAPIEWSAFAVWLTLLLHAHGDNILRFKALLDVEGWPHAVVLDAVHHLVHPPTHLREWPAHPRASQLVVIAQELPVAWLEPSLRRFLALAEGPAAGSDAFPRRSPDAA